MPTQPRFNKHRPGAGLRSPTHGVMSVRLSRDEQAQLAAVAEWIGLPDHSSALRFALTTTYHKLAQVVREEPAK